MNAQDKRYRKTALKMAKEYLWNKRRYKSKEEKKAFKLAEKFRLSKWQQSLDSLPADERQAQLRAYKTYCAKVNFVRNLIIAAATVSVLIIALLVIML